MGYTFAGLMSDKEKEFASWPKPTQEVCESISEWMVIRGFSPAFDLAVRATRILIERNGGMIRFTGRLALLRPNLRALSLLPSDLWAQEVTTRFLWSGGKRSIEKE